MIIVIDNYDSFTYNIVDYLGKLYDDEILIYRNDKTSILDIQSKNPKYIIISPGPKTPSEAGISEDVIKAFYTKIPILGICLGHQAIGEVFGGRIVCANKLMHGKTSQIVHNGDTIFDNIPNPFIATRYHSLVIDKDSIESSDQIMPIAFSEDDQEIMAIKHKNYPLYGVQFHPESILTTYGLTILNNFISLGER